MKDPALYSSGYERIERDAYYTPAWCTEVLLQHVKFNEVIWECAAGTRAMSRVLEAGGYKVVSSDIETVMGTVRTIDFLNLREPLHQFDDIVTNPPFKYAKGFVEQALALTEYKIGKVAMLLRNEWDSAATRQHLFGKCPQFALKLVLTRRPKWFADNKASPRHNFSWFIWDWGHEGPAEIRWGQ